VRTVPRVAKILGYALVRDVALQFWASEKIVLRMNAAGLFVTRQHPKWRVVLKNLNGSWGCAHRGEKGRLAW